jgi:hypothetical protein
MTGPSSADHELLFYRLLPALYRVQDQAAGLPLLALLKVLQSQYDALSGNMDELYDDWFISTCQDWVVPYIGDLLNIPGIDAPHPWPTWRSLVGNTLAYRRRKGTTAALAHAAQDGSGWPTFPVAYQETLGVTQSLVHVRPGRGGTADLRDLQALDDLHTPFNTLAHTAQIASGLPEAPENGRAAFNLALVGLYLWRLPAYPIERGNACRMGSGRYTFHPLGIDVPLFNVPRTLPDPSLVPGPVSLPVRISRQRLRSVLTAAAAKLPEGLAWLTEPPVVAVFVEDPRQPAASQVGPDEIFVADLETWSPPPAGYRIAVDPELGRLTLAPGQTLAAGDEPAGVQVSYAYAFSGDCGGGPYGRSGSDGPEEGEYLALVSRRPPTDLPPGPWQSFTSVTDALAGWQASGRSGTIQIAESATWPVSGAWALANGHSLTLTAAEGTFPCLQGSLSVGTESGGRLTLDGLLLSGPLLLHGDVTLEARDCTLNPLLPGPRPAEDAPPALIANPGESGSTLHLARCLCGPLQVAPRFHRLHVLGCLIDAGGGLAIGPPPLSDATAAAPSTAPPLQIETSTLFGRIRVEELMARDSLFLGRVDVRLRETGSIESSWVPPGSRTPRRYRCQPSLALEGIPDPAVQRRITRRLRPVFTSRLYGQPGYGQLGAACALEIRTGAADGSEMGVFHDLLQPQRRTMLAHVLEEYLPWNLDASTIDAT